MNRFGKRVTAFILSCMLLLSSTVSIVADEMENKDVLKIQKDIEDSVEKMDDADKQLSALTMMNHLMVLSSEINACMGMLLYCRQHQRSVS